MATATTRVPVTLDGSPPRVGGPGHCGLPTVHVFTRHAEDPLKIEPAIEEPHPIVDRIGSFATGPKNDDFV